MLNALILKCKKDNMEFALSNLKKEYAEQRKRLVRSSDTRKLTVAELESFTGSMLPRGLILNAEISAMCKHGLIRNSTSNLSLYVEKLYLNQLQTANWCHLSFSNWPRATKRLRSRLWNGCTTDRKRTGANYWSTALRTQRNFAFERKK